MSYRRVNETVEIQKNVYYHYHGEDLGYKMSRICTEEDWYLTELVSNNSVYIRHCPHCGIRLPKDVIPEDLIRLA